MFDIDFSFWFRIVNVGLAFLAFVGLGMNMVSRRHLITRRARRVLMWVFAMLGIYAYGSWVAYSHDFEVTVVTYAISFVMAGFVLSLIWHPEGDDKRPPHDGSLGQKFLDAFDEAYDHYTKGRQ